MVNDEVNNKAINIEIKVAEYSAKAIFKAIKKIMEDMQDEVFKQYTIESIQFIKTAPAVGYISIELSIVPFGTLEKINIVMGV